MAGGDPREKQAEEAREALRRLDRQDSDVFSSALHRAADHLSARDADPNDAAELWGRRVGRIAGSIAVVILAYLFGHQLGWW